MKHVINHSTYKNTDELKYFGYEDYDEMFQEGMSDSEISHETGVDEKYIKRLRNEYLKDY